MTPVCYQIRFYRRTAGFYGSFDLRCIVFAGWCVIWVVGSIRTGLAAPQVGFRLEAFNVGVAWMNSSRTDTEVGFKSPAQRQASHAPLIRFYPNPYEPSQYSFSHPPLLIAVNALAFSLVKYGNVFLKDSGSSDACMLI